MTVSVEQMLASLRQRSEAQEARANDRARRILERLPEAARMLKQTFGCQRVILFGSLASSQARQDSDVDLAVGGLESLRYFEALTAVRTHFGVPVDLVRLEEAGASLVDRIHSEGCEV